MIDSALRFNISKSEKSIPDRIEMLENIVRGKNVIDLGFADHIELIEEKIKRNRWLHIRLSEVANHCLGIDINEESVNHCKELGFVDIICADMEERPIPEIDSLHWDYIILGEIIEHQNNPSAFLFRLGYHNTIDKYIITTPNAFRIENFLFARKHIECINSDHRFWFTPYTLNQAVTEAGLKVNWFKFCQGSPIPFYNIIKKWLLKRYPALRDTIIMEIQ